MTDSCQRRSDGYRTRGWGKDCWGCAGFCPWLVGFLPDFPWVVGWLCPLLLDAIGSDNRGPDLCIDGLSIPGESARYSSRDFPLELEGLDWVLRGWVIPLEVLGSVFDSLGECNLSSASLYSSSCSVRYWSYCSLTLFWYSSLTIPSAPRWFLNLQVGSSEYLQKVTPVLVVKDCFSAVLPLYYRSHDRDQ